MTLNETIVETIKEVPFASYDSERGRGGVTSTIEWNGEEVLRASSPVRSHCSGAVAEAVLLSLKKHDLEQVIPLEDIVKFIEHGFIYEEETQWSAYPGVIVDLGWGHWTDETDFKPGALAQFWFEDEEETIRKNGHSLILLGRGERDGRQIFKDWSATDIPSIMGHTYDYHNLELIKGGLRRIWYIANLDEDTIRQTYQEN